MVPLEELDSQAVVVTPAPLGLQDMVLLVRLVTKDKQAFLEALGPQACQVQRVNQEKLFLYQAPLEQKDCRGPQASQVPKETEAFLEPQEGQACQERRVLWASRELDFQGPLAPKVLTAYLETWGLQGLQVARDLMAYLGTQVCRARRESLELVYRDSKVCQVFLAFLAHPGRRGALGYQAFLENTERSDPLGFRGSEVNRGLLDCQAPWGLQEFQESAPLELGAPLEDRDHRGCRALLE